MKKSVFLILCILLLPFVVAESEKFSTTIYVNAVDGLMSIDTEDDDLLNINCSQNLPSIPLTIKFERDVEDIQCQTFNYSKIVTDVKDNLNLNLSCEDFDYTLFWNGTDQNFYDHTADMKRYFDEKVIPKEQTLDALKSERDECKLSKSNKITEIEALEEKNETLKKANNNLIYIAIILAIGIIIFAAIEMSVAEKIKQRLS